MLEKGKGKSNWYYADVEYSYWSGTRKHPKLEYATMSGIVFNGWIYDFFGNKKNITGNRIERIENLGQRKPKNFDKKQCDKLKKELGLIIKSKKSVQPTQVDGK